MILTLTPHLSASTNDQNVIIFLIMKTEFLRDICGTDKNKTQTKTKKLFLVNVEIEK